MVLHCQVSAFCVAIYIFFYNYSNVVKDALDASGQEGRGVAIRSMMSNL